LTLTRSLLFESRLAGPLCQHRLDVSEREPARLQQHKQVVDKVRAFRRQRMAVPLDRRDDGLDRFLAQLARAMGRTLVEQLARIGRVAARAGAGVDGRGKIMDGKACHQAVFYHSALRSGSTKSRQD